MQLSAEELIKFNLIKEGTLSVTISEGGEVSLGNQPPPQDCEAQPIKEVMLAIYIQVVEKGAAHLEYDGYNFLIYKRPMIPIIFNDIEFVDWNRKGTPIIKVDGEQLSGYMAISKKLYGTNRRDIAKILKPYLIREFNPENLTFVEYRKVRGNTYPVFTYGDSKKLIKGAKGLRALFPQLTDEYIKQLEPKEMQRPKERHQELIEKFNICKFGDKYEVKDQYFGSQRKVMAFIKSQGESLSRETAKRLFESLNHLQN